jgi:hypothetical protein
MGGSTPGSDLKFLPPLPQAHQERQIEKRRRGLFADLHEHRHPRIAAT